MATTTIRFLGSSDHLPAGWKVKRKSVSFDPAGMKAKLHELTAPCFVVMDGERIGVSNEGFSQGDGGAPDHLNVLSWTPPLPPERIGDSGFRSHYGTRFSYYAGAMANGIASEEMVIALGKAGFIGSFGSGALSPERIEQAIFKIQKNLPAGPYIFNFIHSPFEPALEKATVDLYLKHKVTCAEAAAFIGLTPHIVRYRVSGLGVDAQNNIEIKNKLIAKISRREVAEKFMEPAPEKIVSQLLEQKLITPLQANLASKVPMADDITAEADSGGHTDNRPLVSLLPSMIALRDEILQKYAYDTPVRVGAGGGIGTPAAALAAYMMGAAYVVTGSVNQPCQEAGASPHSKKLLAEADMADVTMAPAADMFEMGVKLQVLKRGTFFPMRAHKLYELYRSYNSMEEIPPKEIEKLEKQIFQKSIGAVWNETVDFFKKRDPSQIEAAIASPKKKMALIFRWYLGLASRWANIGEPKREMDYQIWCGPCIGAFNAWVKNSYLEDVGNRKVADVARHIVTGSAFLYRMRNLIFQGVLFPPDYLDYRPQPFSS